MIGDRLAMIDAETAPAFALGRLQALEQMEEGDRRGGVGLGAASELTEFWMALLVAVDTTAGDAIVQGGSRCSARRVA